MFSKCLGTLHINREKLHADVSNLHEEDYVPDYSEYTVGSWRTAILMNQDGNLRSGEVKEYSGTAQFTYLSQKLPNISKAIEENFDISKIKLARIASIKKHGIILPHVDFVTFSKPCKRYNIALISNKNCISIEEQTAYSMRSGEIWELDATRPHSAGNFSETDRISLIIDFEPPEDEETYFTQSNNIGDSDDILLVERAEITDEMIAHYTQLSTIINAHNYRDVLSIIAKIPFFWRVDLVYVFTLMKQICEHSNNKMLIDNITKTERAFLYDRITDPVAGIL
jgi:L-proline cis-4-hydroxylase